MEDERLKPGDDVTVRKGAPFLPEGLRKLPQACRTKVVDIEGRQVKVETTAQFSEDDDGSKRVGRFAMFDVTYVFKVDRS